MTEPLTPARINALLTSRYGSLHWWPASTPYEVMAGAVLTQNTNWSNVEKALSSFPSPITPETVEALDLMALRDLIRPAGFFNQKSVYLKALTAWYKGYGYSPETVSTHAQTSIRSELLSLKGIGLETADSILLYAFGFPEFVSDAYTKRLLTRLGVPGPLDYAAAKGFFERGLPRNAALYNNLHAMIVINGKERCRKAAPKCPGCPLEAHCKHISE